MEAAEDAVEEARRIVEGDADDGRAPSFDARAGAINAMFDFAHPRRDCLILNPATGEIL